MAVVAFLPCPMAARATCIDSGAQTPVAWNVSGVACAESGDLAAAVEAFRTALDSTPDFASASINLARAYGLLNRPAAAVETLKKALLCNREPGLSITLRAALAAALIARGNETEATRILQIIVSDNPQSADARFQLGSVYGKQTLYREALDEFLMALKLDAAHSAARLEAGKSFLWLHEAERAALYLEEYVERAADSFDGRLYLGRAYRDLGKNAEAIRQLKAAARLNPASYDAHYFLGVLLGEKDDDAGAIQHLEAARAIAPKTTDVRYALARLYRKNAQEELSGREYEAVRRLQNDHSLADQATAHLNRAAEFLTKGNPREAVDACRRALALSPGDARIHYNLALALAGLGDEAGRKAALDQALKIDGRMAAAGNELSLLHLRAGNSAEAEQDFRKALDSNPEHLEALNNLGVIQSRNGKTAEAVVLFQRAIAAKPSFSEAQLNLGLTEAGLGRWDVAKTHLSRALEHPNRKAEVYAALGLIALLEKTAGLGGR